MLCSESAVVSTVKLVDPVVDAVLGTVLKFVDTRSDAVVSLVDATVSTIKSVDSVLAGGGTGVPSTTRSCFSG